MTVLMIVSISDQDWTVDVEGALNAATDALRAHDITVMVQVRDSVVAGGNGEELASSV